MNKTYLMVPVKPVKHDLVSEIDKFIHVPLATYDTYGSVKIGSGLIVDRGVVSFDAELMPTELSELIQDSEHRLVTDSQIEYWDNKPDVLELNKYYTKTESDSLLNEKTDNTTTEKLTERVVKNETNIDVLTQNKANKSDIIDDLTTNNSNQMLSARQGYRLNNMINDINALLKSDNINLDTIQEIVNYIENNKDLIDSITLTKVNVSDVIDNLTTTDSTKPLSANQGVVLKNFIDALPEWTKQPTKPTYYYSEILERPAQVRVSITKVGIPTKVSQLENDANYATEQFVKDFVPDVDFSEIEQRIEEVAESVPTKTSELQNNGDGVSKFATEEFVKNNTPNIPDDFEIPTKTSDLTNDGDGTSPFVTLLSTYTKEEVNALISAINSMKQEIVEQLPTENIDENTIYLVPKTTGSGNDYYDEYLYINGNFECIGCTQIDLSGYVKNTDYPKKNMQNAGVVKIAGFTGVAIRSDGTLQVEEAFTSDITSQSNMRVMLPKHVPEIVRQGLINPKNITWTDEEKALAQATLGIDLSNIQVEVPTMTIVTEVL